MKKKTKILKTVVISAGTTLFLIGIIVIQSVETVKTGYQIIDLNKKWREENSKYIKLELKHTRFVKIEVMERFIRANFSLKYPDPEELVFVRVENDAGK